MPGAEIFVDGHGQPTSAAVLAVIEDAEAAWAIERRIAQARRLALQCVPLADTIAEIYLTRERGIPKPTAGWPNDVLFHAPSLALLLIARDAEARAQAVQRVFLSNAGRKIDEMWLEPRGLQAVKQTNGPIAGAVMRLPGPPDCPVMIGEGPETAMSTWAAMGWETHPAFGPIGGYRPPAGTSVIEGPKRLRVALRDRDAPFSPADNAFHAAMAKWIRAHQPFAIASPYDHFTDKDHKDFNDLLRHEGLDAVRARIEAAMAPRPSVPRQTKAAARLTLAETIETFMDPRRTYDLTAVHAICVDTGGGKTEEALKQMAERVTELRAQGNIQTAALMVPTLDLADEALGRFRKLESGLTAAVWRGRRADDPDSPGETMCRSPKAVKEARRAGASIETSCCRSTAHGTQCQFYETCAYQRQKRQRPDVWITAHHLLFSEKPKSFGQLSMIVVDESMLAAGLTGTVDWSYLPLASIELDPASWTPEEDYFHAMRKKAMQALRRFRGPAPVARVALVAVGLTAEHARTMARVEWTRLIERDLHPEMKPGERAAALKAMKGNADVRKFVAMWTEFATLLESEDADAVSGWAWVCDDAWEEPVLRLKGRRPIRKGWQVPTLLLDATMDIDLVRFYWPTAQLTANIRIAAPHQRIIQVDDALFGRSSLVPGLDPESDGSAEKQNARRRKLERLRGILWRLAGRYTGRVLIVMQKAVETALEGRLPANVVTAHHNAISGRDEWGDVAALIVVGRTQPRPEAVESQAEALTGVAIKSIGKWFYPRVVEREMVDGSLVYGAADIHPDPIAEKVRWQNCEAELVQIIGRARGVNRTAADPVDVYVLTSTPIHLPVDEVVALAELAPTLRERMLAAGGVALLNPAHAWRAYPQLFASAAAAEKALQRERTEMGEPSECRLWTYQLEGPGNRPCRCWISDAASDPAATIARLLGGRVKWARVERSILRVCNATAGGVGHP